MCYGCWQYCGSPKIVNEKTLGAASLVRKVYESNSVGGSLHIVLDDFNIEDSHVRWCIKHQAENFHDDSDRDAERECAKAFRAMSVAERASALAMAHEFFTP